MKRRMIIILLLSCSLLAACVEQPNPPDIPPQQTIEKPEVNQVGAKTVVRPPPEKVQQETEQLEPKPVPPKVNKPVENPHSLK